ncbi:MAG: 1-acyl-sn-glycerol-3-phosphate acyltransferase [Gammaproteobacteria bacterium]|nr:1-acyl-sn-glycerol-3-phosphate acyltransferase [Gammaproteobacteria bacterium]
MSSSLKVFYFLRMVVFYLSLAVVTFFFGIVMTLLMLPFPYKVRFHCIISGWCHSMCFLMRVVCGIKYEVVGRENLHCGPAIILSKHSSRWETIALPMIISTPTLVLKKEILRFPVIGWSAAQCEVIAIDRSKGAQALKMLIAEGKKCLKKGRQIVMFPEGSRKGGGYKKGGIMLARAAQVPIVPIAHNAHECWPNRQFYLTPGKIKVVIGEPIEVEGKTANQLLDEVRDWIEGQVAAISTRMPEQITAVEENS